MCEQYSTKKKGKAIVCRIKQIICSVYLETFKNSFIWTKTIILYTSWYLNAIFAIKSFITKGEF